MLGEHLAQQVAARCAAGFDRIPGEEALEITLQGLGRLVATLGTLLEGPIDDALEVRADL